MQTINQSTKLGYVGKNPELRYTATGAAVASFSVATSERWTDNEGNDREETTWHNCVAFGNLASIVDKLIGKGSLVYVQGRDQKRTYTDRDGIERSAHQIVIETVSVMPAARANPTANPTAEASAAGATAGDKATHTATGKATDTAPPQAATASTGNASAAGKGKHTKSSAKPDAKPDAKATAKASADADADIPF